MRWAGLRAMGLRPLAGVLALVCALAMAVVVVYQPAAGPSELEVRLRSVRYYRAMASADAYDAGPGAVQRAASSKARLQQLALSAPKGGQLSHSLIRACSGGDDGACAQIANSRSMMAALKHRVRHPGHRAVQRAVSVTAPAAPVRAALPVTARGRRAGARAPAGGQASDVAGLANWMSWNPEQAATTSGCTRARRATRLRARTWRAPPARWPRSSSQPRRRSPHSRPTSSRRPPRQSTPRRARPRPHSSMGCSAACSPGLGWATPTTPPAYATHLRPRRWTPTSG